MCTTLHSYEDSSKRGVVLGVLDVLQDTKNLEAYRRDMCLRQRAFWPWRRLDEPLQSGDL
jgi:hypothetical protein